MLDVHTRRTPVPATMTAVWQDRYRTPEVLVTSRGVAVPDPEPHQVLLQVHAAGISRGVMHMTTGLPRLVRLASGVRGPLQDLSAGRVAGKSALTITGTSLQ